MTIHVKKKSVTGAQSILQKPRKIPREENDHEINLQKRKRASMLLSNQEPLKEHTCEKMFVSDLAQEWVRLVPTFLNG